MTDPAIEAVQRAWGSTVAVGAGGNVINPWQVAVFATREALKPIRELIDRWHDESVHTQETWRLMDDLAPLIYTTEELGR